jgi:hypothetical protein
VRDFIWHHYLHGCAANGSVRCSAWKTGQKGQIVMDFPLMHSILTRFSGFKPRKRERHSRADNGKRRSLAPAGFPLMHSILTRFSGLKPRKIVRHSRADNGKRRSLAPAGFPLMHSILTRFSGFKPRKRVRHSRADSGTRRSLAVVKS